MGERLTVSIDYCPQCRGIWLEKGKLDQIIERSAASSPAAVQRSAMSGQGYPPSYGRHDDHHDHHDDDHYKKKKKGFLGDLFD
jgi:Zn-finger nucleic acid-binding protein